MKVIFRGAGSAMIIISTAGRMVAAAIRKTTGNNIVVCYEQNYMSGIMTKGVPKT